MKFLQGIALVLIASACFAEGYWTNWPDLTTARAPGTSTEEWPDHSSISPGGPLNWRYRPANTTSAVGGYVVFTCSVYAYYHSNEQVHIVWLKEGAEGGCDTLFYDDKRWDAPPHMYVYVWGSDYYYYSSELTISSVKMEDFAQYTCQIHAEGGANELKEHVHLERARVAKSTCPSGWSIYEGHCYARMDHPDLSSWREANNYCHGVGVNSSLASIHDNNEYRHIDRLLTYTDDVWIGLFYHQHGYRFEWHDGDYYDYSKWMWGYPTNPRDNGCVAMSYSSDGWHNIPCGDNSTISGFVCKAPAFEYEEGDLDDDCPYGFRGYKDNCYYVDPDNTIDCRDVYYWAEPLDIQSPDENKIVCDLARESSNVQHSGYLRLSASFNALAGGWVWSNSQPMRFKNFRADDNVHMDGRIEGIDMDMVTGEWRHRVVPGEATGTLCKFPKWRLLGEEKEEGAKEETQGIEEEEKVNE